MRSRLPAVNRITLKQQKAIREQVEIEITKMNEQRTNLILKLMCYVLNREFGFGKLRLSVACQKIGDLANEHEQDEAFWEHLDRVVIDEIGIGFTRD